MSIYTLPKEIIILIFRYDNNMFMYSRIICNWIRMCIPEEQFIFNELIYPLTVTEVSSIKKNFKLYVEVNNLEGVHQIERFTFNIKFDVNSEAYTNNMYTFNNNADDIRDTLKTTCSKKHNNINIHNLLSNVQCSNIINIMDEFNESLHAVDYNILSFYVDIKVLFDIMVNRCTGFGINPNIVTLLLSNGEKNVQYVPSIQYLDKYNYLGKLDYLNLTISKTYKFNINTIPTHLQHMDLSERKYKNIDRELFKNIYYTPVRYYEYTHSNKI
jgi:hypothetical protein